MRSGSQDGSEGTICQHFGAEFDEFYAYQNGLEKLILECDLIIKKLLVAGTPPASTLTSIPISSSEGKGVRLPKLDAPTFDGKLGYHFVSSFSRANLSNVEKLAYLRNALKDGSAKGIIDGLSTSGEFYEEAIESLKARYNRP